MQDIIKLSPKQEEAVLHFNGAILVVASAGSGKTRILTERIKRLIERTKRKILAITFTNKAGEEMRERLGDDEKVKSQVFIGTFHGFCQQVLEMRFNMIGLSKSEIHKIGSYYDLMNRLWLQDPKSEYEFKHSLHPFKRKPSKKYGKNKKQPPRHPGVIQKLVDLALQGKTFESRPELLMQQVFAKIGVEPAAKDGLYGDTKKLTISGDGTCINSGGSSYGIKVCECVKNGDFNCKCMRKFSDADARRG